MKKYIGIIVMGAIVVASCKPEFDDVEVNGGSANFSTYVALGNSLTAGYADRALYRSGQESSYPNIMATQMKLVNGGEFKQPYMNDDLGGMTLSGVELSDYQNKLALSNAVNCQGDTAAGPNSIDGAHATAVEDNIYSSGPFNNMGVPGAKVTHLVAPGYGDVANLQLGAANPYFVRMASSSNATVLEDAIAQSPTFFSLWIGNNDVLGYATTGGADPNSPITNQALFATVYENMVDQLVATGAKGVLANLPDVTSIPFFTTVSVKTIALSATDDANNLTAIFNQIGNYVDTTYGAGLGEQYRYEYVVGDNLFLVKTDVTVDNPLGIDQINEDDLVLLTIPADSIRCFGYGSMYTDGYDPFNDPITEAINRLRPLGTEHFLDATERAAISAAIEGFNSTIKTVADKHNLALADMHENLKDIAENNYVHNEVEYSTNFVTGGAFSLDGVHLTSRGYALTANYFIDAINAKYTSTLPKVNINTYDGLHIP